ncbi:hypothetical protein [Streptosporangium sp. NPDC049046]|uniref:hypothetical protein n=1 Tax=Streptosporangium sp. NPDC049046 TaxID=3155031 RepID=UPI00343B483D
MSEEKARITNTAPGVAGHAKRMADQRALTLLREHARRADPERVARMMRHVNRQLTEQGFPPSSN